MKKKLLLLAALLLALAVILPACHTVLVGLRTINGNINCGISVSYQVPGFGIPVQNAGPHSLTHPNVTSQTGFDDIGAGFGPNFELAYSITGSCIQDGTGVVSGINPNISQLWDVTWTVNGNQISAAAAAK